MGERMGAEMNDAANLECSVINVKLSASVDGVTRRMNDNGYDLIEFTDTPLDIKSDAEGPCYHRETKETPLDAKRGEWVARYHQADPGVP